MKPINEEEMHELLTRIDDDTQQAVIRLAWQAGLTAEEIGRLMWSDVDFTRDTIRAGNRTIPMAYDLSDFFSQMDQKGPFVIYSRKDTHSPSSRNNITLKSREAFRRMGLNDMTLKTLKYDFIVRSIDKMPIENVSRITGISRQYLREIYKRYTGSIPPDPPHAKPELFFDKNAILAATEKEKYSIDSTALLLSMMGGLTMEEVSELKWNDVNFSFSEICIRDTTFPIPQYLAKYLKRLKKCSSSSSPYVLHGVISNNRLDPIFIVKHVRQFLVRNNLDAVNLSVLRGAYASLGRSEMELAVINKMKHGISSVERLGEELNIGRTKMIELLNGLCKDGKIHYVEESKQYVLSGQQNNWEKVLSALSDCADDNGNISMSCLMSTTGLANSLLRYYLNKAIKEGRIIKVGPAKYHVVK
jgi:integrase/biotin operon repressor